jgi:hypothetical protein
MYFRLSIRTDKKKEEEDIEANMTNDVCSHIYFPTETVVLSLFSSFVCITIDENTKGVLE